MITLCIRYSFDSSHVADFRDYVEAEQSVIERSGGRIVGYFLPTDFAGPTNEAVGLIDLPSPTSNIAKRWPMIPTTRKMPPGWSRAAPR
jgi:hypothetical protein